VGQECKMLQRVRSAKDWEWAANSDNRRELRRNEAVHAGVEACPEGSGHKPQGKSGDQGGELI